MRKTRRYSPSCPWHVKSLDVAAHLSIIMVAVPLLFGVLEGESSPSWMTIAAIPVVLIIVGFNPTQPSRKPVLLNA